MTADEVQARLTDAAVLPILTVRDLDATLRLVEALVSGGVSAIEIVLRTPIAVEAIEAVRVRFPELLVGAGTVVSPDTLDCAVETGAHVLISPGLPLRLLEHHRGHAVPMIPGVLSPTEVLTARDAGYRLMKYYPAVASNGSLVLDDYVNLFPDVSFVPTGKIGFETLPDYAGVRNVCCVGGSWMQAGSLEQVRDKVVRSLDIMRSLRPNRTS